MSKRYVSIWFRHLATDWFSLRQPQLKTLPFVLRSPSHGRMVITSTNAVAESKGIHQGIVPADARAIVPELEVQDDKPDLREKLLTRLAEWCIRFSPIVAVDLPDGLLLDASGCPHLWGGDQHYVKDIAQKLNARGYDVQLVIADTIGVAYGAARFGKDLQVISSENHLNVLMALPSEALRLEADVIERLHKLGLHKVRQLIKIPSPSLRRRFGHSIGTRLNMALGIEMDAARIRSAAKEYERYSGECLQKAYEQTIKATSAPNSPGALRRVRASKSVATQNVAPAAWTSSARV